MDSRQGARDNKIMTLLIVAVLSLTLTCLAGIFVEEVPDKDSAPVPVATAAGTKEEPQIVSGFVPNRLHMPPEPRQEAFFLSWDFINGLFAIILLVEFIVFPILFWLWFGKDKHTESK